MELFLDFEDLKVLIFEGIGVVDGLGFQEFVFDDISESFFPVDIFLILLFPGVVIGNEPVEFPLPLPDDTFHILILNPVLFDRFVNVVYVGLELREFCSFHVKFLLFFDALVVWINEYKYIVFGISDRVG